MTTHEDNLRNIWINRMASSMPRALDEALEVYNMFKEGRQPEDILSHLNSYIESGAISEFDMDSGDHEMPESPLEFEAEYGETSEEYLASLEPMLPPTQEQIDRSNATYGEDLCEASTILARGIRRMTVLLTDLCEGNTFGLGELDGPVIIADLLESTRLLDNMVEES